VNGCDCKAKCCTFGENDDETVDDDDCNADVDGDDDDDEDVLDEPIDDGELVLFFDFCFDCLFDMSLLDFMCTLDTGDCSIEFDELSNELFELLLPQCFSDLNRFCLRK